MWYCVDSNNHHAVFIQYYGVAQDEYSYGRWMVYNVTMVTRMTIQILVIQHHSNKKRERELEGE